MYPKKDLNEDHKYKFMHIFFGQKKTVLYDLLIKYVQEPLNIC